MLKKKSVLIPMELMWSIINNITNPRVLLSIHAILKQQLSMTLFKGMTYETNQWISKRQTISTSSICNPKLT